MTAVWMLARKDLRPSWRSALFLVVLVAVVGTVVFATAAGARRSNTALSRFTAFSEPSDLSYLTAFTYSPTPAQVEAVGRIPNVEGFTELRFYGARAPQFAAVANVAADIAERGTVDRELLVSGRAVNPDAADEVELDASFAHEAHLRVGDTIDLDTFTQAQVNQATGGPPPDALGPKVRIRIVGIERRPVDVGTAPTQTLFELPPGFDRAYGTRVGNFGGQFDIRTKHGLADRSAVTAAMQHIFPNGVSGQDAVQSDAQRAQSAIDALTLALWIIAAVAALAGAVAIGIVMSREFARASDDQPTLRTLGLTRSQRMLVFGPRTAMIALVGSLGAITGAIALSPRFPIGIARQADPSVGVHADWVVVGLGGVALLVAVFAIATVAVARTTRVATTDDHTRPSVVVERATRAGSSPTLTNGLRLAFEPGRGRTAVPVRSAFLGAVVGVFGITAAVAFTTSLQRLVSSPARYGWTWNVVAVDTNFTSDAAGCTANDLGVAKVPGVTAVAGLCVNEVQIGNRPVNSWAFTPVRGTIPPAVIAGQAPEMRDEVALGPQTMAALHTHVGTTISVHGAGPSSSYLVVGEAVFADARDGTPLSDGALFTQPGLSRVFDKNNSSHRYVVADVAAGKNPTQVANAVAQLPGVSAPATRILPVEVSRLQGIRNLPFVLAALLAALGAIAVGHALVTGTRRRRRDFALLKTLGFTRRQVETTVAWQATALAGVGVVVGLPLGWLLGRALWIRVEHNLGVVSTPAIGLLTVVLIAIATVVVVNVIAWLPARAAARRRAGLELRAE
jgi:hypothetical protein